MKFGSGKVTKLEYGKVMAACLAYLILLQRDAAAVTVFDQKVREHHQRTNNMAKSTGIKAADDESGDTGHSLERCIRPVVAPTTDRNASE